jgi:hypothetical protein
VRFRVDPFGPDDDESPAVDVQLFAAINIVVPLRVVVGVLSTVVLDDKQQVGVRQIEPFRPRSHRVVLDVVDHRLGQPGQDHQHPQPRLHRRVDSFAHVADRP